MTSPLNPFQPPCVFLWTLQKGLTALEALLQRKQGVDGWTTEDVIVWLHDIGLWSEKTEREASHKLPLLTHASCNETAVCALSFFQDISCLCF